jgi:hypothetical protein
MAIVSVLAAAHINHRKVRRWLARAGYAIVADADRVSISRHGRWDVVDTGGPNLAGLPDSAVQSAKALLGFAPRDGITCSFEGEPRLSDSWPTVIDIARAVASNVPLAVLYDHAGTAYLVHPVRGLIEPAEYEAVRRDSPTSDLLRRFFRDRI